MENKASKQYPPGHYLSMGITFGIIIGTGVGAALDNIGIGPAIGVALGAGIGSAWEAKAKSEGKIRELTEEEKQKVKKRTWLALAVGFIVAVSVTLVYFLQT